MSGGSALEPKSKSKFLINAGLVGVIGIGGIVGLIYAAKLFTSAVDRANEQVSSSLDPQYAYPSCETLERERLNPVILSQRLPNWNYSRRTGLDQLVPYGDARGAEVSTGFFEYPQGYSTYVTLTELMGVDGHCQARRVGVIPPRDISRYYRVVGIDQGCEGGFEKVQVIIPDCLNVSEDGQLIGYYDPKQPITHVFNTLKDAANDPLEFGHAYHHLELARRLTQRLGLNSK